MRLLLLSYLLYLFIYLLPFATHIHLHLLPC
nr:MAG TPA: hypothetical protein [Caudoviricetes sp.]